MAERPRERVEADDFPGLVLNLDPHDLPPGAAADQVNAVSITPGQLSARLGYKEVTFES